MSWKIINTILGLASVDQTFCRELLANPLQAVQTKQFELTPEEEAIFKRISARDLAEFSQMLLAYLDASKKRE
jgi:hypothetical protein